MPQAFEMCEVRGWNLSYACLTGYAARSKLRELRDTDPKFWDKLTSSVVGNVNASRMAGTTAHPFGGTMTTRTVRMIFNTLNYLNTVKLLIFVHNPHIFHIN